MLFFKRKPDVCAARAEDAEVGDDLQQLSQMVTSRNRRGSSLVESFQIPQNDFKALFLNLGLFLSLFLEDLSSLEDQCSGP